MSSSHQPAEIASSWITSLLLHATLLIILMLITVGHERRTLAPDLIASWTADEPLASQLQEAEQPKVELAGVPADAENCLLESLTSGAIGPPLDSVASSASPPLPALSGVETAPQSDLLIRIGGGLSGGLEGRTPAGRARLAGERGGNGASEQAVEAGLRWLVAHQQRDGSWNFDHTRGACKGLCRDPGSVTSTTAATAIALLPFLGAGYTHVQGEHQYVVRSGLMYLQNKMQRTPNGGDLQEGTMYAQALAAIALCEAYAMTRDRALKPDAQAALDFIVYAQDKTGGGWRYSPGQPGDTTVTGWQLMALKSGQMAYLMVPRQCFNDAGRFLNSVQDEYGAYYGYQDTERRPATTAVGLLCRMYLGWDHDRPALARGVQQLVKWGPSKDDIYFNYYAGQVLNHWGGRDWERWNEKLRDHLVATQSRKGHESGSWYFKWEKTAPGGRLFYTAAAIMTLEVYYRYMPLYQESAIEDF